MHDKDKTHIRLFYLHHWTIPINSLYILNWIPDFECSKMTNILHLWVSFKVLVVSIVETICHSMKWFCLLHYIEYSKCAGFAVLFFVVVMISVFMDPHVTFIHTFWHLFPWIGHWALGKWYGCLSASDITLKIMVNQLSSNHNKTQEN